MPSFSTESVYATAHVRSQQTVGEGVLRSVEGANNPEESLLPRPKQVYGGFLAIVTATLLMTSIDNNPRSHK